MGDRRSLLPLVSGDFDIPPATITLAEDSMTRLDRLGRALEAQREEVARQREEAERSRDALRQRGWVTLPGLRRRRWLRTSGTHSPTYEGRVLSRDHRFPDSEDEDRREVKRRKLDAFLDAREVSFKYGYYGQVEPGRLKFELCSCDGGVHSHRDTGHYGPTNILKHDQSVYSSKSPRCNIILQHHDGTTFTLESLTIIAPGHGFTAPVKRGTVCVAMGYDDLIPLSAQEILNDDASEESDHEEDEEADEDDDGDEERLGLLERLNDPRLLAAAAASSHNDDSWPPPSDWLPEPLPAANNSSNRYGRIWGFEGGWPPLEPSTRMRIDRSAPRPANPTTEEVTLDSGLRVTMGQQHDLGPPEPTGRSISEEERRRRSRDETLAALDGVGSDSWEGWCGMQRMQRSSWDRSRGRRASEGGGKTSGGMGAGVTQIPFEIQDGTSSVTIKFDPPVSGTCLLLRLQSKAKSNNVDIQSVIATGYAGPRFFPALTMK